MKRIYCLLQPHCDKAVMVEHVPAYRVVRHPLGVRSVEFGRIMYRCEHEVPDQQETTSAPSII